MRFICSFILNGKHLAPKEVRDIGSNPIRSIICPSGGMADAVASKAIIRSGVWVQIPPWAP